MPSVRVAPTWLLLLAGLIMLSPLVEGGTSHLAVMGIRLIVLSWIAVYLWTSIESKAFRYWTSPFLFLVLLFLSVAGYATVRSSYTHQSLQWFLVLLTYAGLFYLIVLYIGTWDHIQKLLMVVVGMGVFEAVWAGIQAMQGVLRPTGTFFNPNFLSGYLAVSFILIVAYFIHLPLREVHWRISRKSAVPSFIRLGLPLLVAVCLLMITLLSGSRGGLLALVAGAMVIIGVRLGWKGQALIILLLLMVVLLPNPLQQRVLAEHDRNPAAYSRIQIWEGAIHMMGEYPLGIGLGLYRYFAPQYAFPIESQIVRYGQISRTAHNEFLQIGVEMGVIGLLVFLAGISLLMLETKRLLRTRLTRRERTILVGAAGGVTVILAHAMVDSNLHVPSLAVLLTLLAAMLVSASRLAGVSHALVREWPVQRTAVWGGMGVCLVGGALFFIMKFSLAWLAYESGLQAMQERNITNALTAYQEAVSTDPGKALYRSALASAFFQKYQSSDNLTNAQQAISELQRAIKLNPVDGRVYGLLGHVLSYTGSSLSRNQSTKQLSRELLEEAYEAYHTSLQFEPFSVFHRLELARISLLLGTEKQGETFIQEAILIEPNFLPGREWLVKRWWKSGRKEEARLQFKEILTRRDQYKHVMNTQWEKKFLRVDLPALASLTESIG